MAAVVEIVTAPVLTPAAIGIVDENQPIHGTPDFRRRGSTPAALNAHSADHVP